MWRTAFHALIGVYLRHERGRTLLTILGVALGVAVLIAIDLAIESAVASFKGTMRDVAGRATLTVRGNGIGLPPSLLPEIARHRGVQSAAPLIQGHAAIAARDGRSTETLLLLGVDLLASEEHGDEPIRDLELTVQEGLAFSRFFVDPALLMITERLAQRTGAGLGDELTLHVGGRPRRFSVGAIAKGDAFANSLDGGVVVVDIAMADVLLTRQGLIDRIDLVTAEGADVEDVRQSLQDMLGGNVQVERPRARGRQVDAILAAFRFNLNALGHISLLVGAFLIFNTMSVAVARRTAVIGAVRALGLTRGRVRAVFIVEGALLGLAGGALGAVGGVLLAGTLLDVVSKTISLNFVQVHAGGLVPAADVVLAAVGLGVAFSVVAALGPANDAAATAPANTLRRGALEGRPVGLVRRVAVGLALALAAALLLSANRTPGIPWAGYGASLCLVLAFVVWARPILALAAGALRGPFAYLFGAEGLLAIASTRGALGRTGVAISGLMIALGMTISIGVMVASFRETVVVWMNQVLRADLYLSPRAVDATLRPEPMPAALADPIEALPGVKAVDPFRVRPVMIDGQPAQLGAGRFDLARYHVEFRIVDGRRALDVLTRARDQGEVIVSEAFARKRVLAAGDLVAVPTPRGVVNLRIAGVYYEYSSEQGYVIMDRELYLEYFDDPMIDTLSIYLEDGADRDAVRGAIRQAAANVEGMPLITIRANDQLRENALDTFNQTFRVTYVMELIAIVIAVLGVANTLLAQILDRRDEIATLRTIGATRGRVARLVILESGLIGLVGSILGVAAGLALSWILAKVIMLQSFGWTIQYHIPWATVAHVALLVWGSTLLAGIPPARQASRLELTRPRTVSG